MNIVLASDDNYVPLLTISIVSVLENNQIKMTLKR